MVRVEISDVRQYHREDDLVQDAHLDQPRTGVVDGYAFEVNGWVVGTKPIVAVEFLHDSWVAARCVPTIPART